MQDLARRFTAVLQISMELSHRSRDLLNLVGERFTTVPRYYLNKSSNILIGEFFIQLSFRILIIVILNLVLNLVSGYRNGPA